MVSHPSTYYHTQLMLLHHPAVACTEVKPNQSKIRLMDRLSSPLLSQGRSSSSSSSSKKDGPIFPHFHMESSSQSLAEDSCRRADASIIRTLAEICYLCGEVRH